MDIAYLHVWHVKWLRKEASHLVGDASRRDEDASPPALEKAALDFMKWDSKNLN
jgi:hypothetical protein